MTFYAHHGVLEQERSVGNTFTLDLSLSLNGYHSLYSDELSDTINYAEVYALVEEEMQSPSKLLEYVVGRISRRLFEAFPQIEEMYLKLSKCKPPFSADIQSAGVSLSISRQEV